MNALHLVARLSLLDFQERSRRFGFLLTLAFVLYAAFLFLPPNHARYATLQFDGYRGVYNSAWVGTLVALQTSVFLSLAGFYLVKNAVQRDRRTGVGEVLAATRLSNRQYILSKMLSNFLVLASMVAVMVVAAGAMQLVRQEDAVLRPLVLLAPFVFLTLPMMALVAAVAALFESIRWLRGGLGNVIFYFVWTAMLTMSAVQADGANSGLDPVGFRVAVPDMVTSCARAFPEFDPENSRFSTGFNIRPDGQTWDLTTFTWDGIAWTGAIALGRLLWIGIAFAALFLSAVMFDRFDPALLEGSRAKGAPKKKNTGQAVLPSTPLPLVPESAPSYASLARMSGVRESGGVGQLARLVTSELRLGLVGVSRWWYAVAAGAALACLFAPMELVRAFFFPLAWIWPILIWSALGTREARYGTDALLYSSPRPLIRQLPAVWLSGVAIAVLTGSGMVVRLLLQGDLAGAGGWLAGALFIPSFALFLGSVSGSSKLFEILYLIVWYVGPLNKAPVLDFMGVAPESHAAGAPYLFAGAAALLVFGSFVARRRRLRN